VPTIRTPQGMVGTLPLAHPADMGF